MKPIKVYQIENYLVKQLKKKTTIIKLMKTEFSKRLYDLRTEKNLTQSQLAKHIQVTQKAIDFWEKSINEPKASYVIKLAKFFYVTTDYLLGLEN